MSGDQPITGLVQRFYRDAWNRSIDASVDELLGEDFVIRGSLGDEAVGPDGFRAYRDKVQAAFSDFQVEVQEIVADGDRAAVRLRCTGRHDGELFGIAPTGAQIAYPAAAFFHARDGRLRAAWVLGDIDALRTQLGQSPPSGTIA
jgi:predicted ester cyclase